MTQMVSTALVAVMADPGLASLEAIRSDLSLAATVRQIEMAAECLGCATRARAGRSHGQVVLAHRDMAGELRVNVEGEPGEPVWITFDSGQGATRAA